MRKIELYMMIALKLDIQILIGVMVCAECK